MLSSLMTTWVTCSHLYSYTEWSKILCAPDDYSTNSLYSNNPHTIDELKMAITEYIWNVDGAVLNTVFENTVQHVNKCLVPGVGHFEHYL